jgi:hypothetical protein
VILAQQLEDQAEGLGQTAATFVSYVFMKVSGEPGSRPKWEVGK